MSENIREILARMWIECDPNRQAVDPDQKDHKGEARWKWFEPRAEATLSYLEKHGLQIVPKDTP